MLAAKRAQDELKFLGALPALAAGRFACVCVCVCGIPRKRSADLFLEAGM